jgi:uncharacterized protein YycO
MSGIAKALLLVAALMSSAAARSQALQDGDIVFQTSRSGQSLAVQQATGSKYSHMGIVIYRGKQPFVFEAAARVQYTPLGAWVSRGINGSFVAKRLVAAADGLSAADIERLRRTAATFEGRPYDLTFEWSDDRIYCSELVWKIYDRALGIRLAELQQIQDFNLRAPAVQTKLHERYGTRIPLHEPVISPAAIFASRSLVTLPTR